MDLIFDCLPFLTYGFCEIANIQLIAVEMYSIASFSHPIHKTERVFFTWDWLHRMPFQIPKYPSWGFSHSSWELLKSFLSHQPQILDMLGLQLHKFPVNLCWVRIVELQCCSFGDCGDYHFSSLTNPSLQLIQCQYKIGFERNNCKPRFALLSSHAIFEKILVRPVILIKISCATLKSDIYLYMCCNMSAGLVL